MMKTMSDKQISHWKKERKKGQFSYILKDTIILSPLIILFLIVYNHFFCLVS